MLNSLFLLFHYNFYMNDERRKNQLDDHPSIPSKDQHWLHNYCKHTFTALLYTPHSEQTYDPPMYSSVSLDVHLPVPEHLVHAVPPAQFFVNFPVPEQVVQLAKVDSLHILVPVPGQ